MISRIRFTAIVLIILLGTTACSVLQTRALPSAASNYEVTSNFYDTMLHYGNGGLGDEVNIAALNLFLTQMPKGGDIHHHYTGTIYAETYLDWVGREGWRIDSCSLKIIKSGKPGLGCDALTAAALIADDSRYRQLLMLWSDKDFYNHSHQQPSPDVNFFNTFQYFGPVSDEYMDVGLNIIKQRALKENVSYIETMLSQVGVKSSDYFSSRELTNLNAQLREAHSQQAVDVVLGQLSDVLLGNEKFLNQVNAFTQMVENNHKGIDNDEFMMRYQSYAVRVLDPVQVFMGFLSAYRAAENSPLIVGVNILAPENNPVALADYTLHMRMYNYLLRRNSNVNRSLHAGELTGGMVRPKNLIFHIQQARDIAHAQRIGHGVDLPYEEDSLSLLADLKAHAAIEINLTSNQFILGVQGNEHPYLIYSAYGVPLVIATDDSGVSRNNLTNEYMLLASRYRPHYSKIKEYVYNSIRYSFLSHEDKATGVAMLNKKFERFEEKIAQFYRKE